MKMSKALRCLKVSQPWASRMRIAFEAANRGGQSRHVFINPHTLQKVPTNGLHLLGTGGGVDMDGLDPQAMDQWLEMHQVEILNDGVLVGLLNLPEGKAYLGCFKLIMTHSHASAAALMRLLKWSPLVTPLGAVRFDSRRLS